MTALPFITEANVRASKASARSPYPHMSAHDVVVWDAFLALHNVTFTSLAYDVAVGGRLADAVADEAADKPMWVSLLKKRIDVVMQRANEVWTFEVKPTANMSALGQALTYANLWKIEGRTALAVRPVIVCHRIDLDVEVILPLYGVLAFAVQPLGPGASVLEKQVGAFV